MPGVQPPPPDAVEVARREPTPAKRGAPLAQEGDRKVISQGGVTREDLDRMGMSSYAGTPEYLGGYFDEVAAGVDAYVAEKVKEAMEAGTMNDQKKAVR